MQNSKVWMPKHLDTSTKALMAKILVQYARPRRSSWTESVRSSFGRNGMGTAIRECSILNTVGKKFWIGNVYSLTEKKAILICVCGRYQIGWKETKHWSDMESTQKKVDLGEPTSFLDHVYLGCTQRNVRLARILWIIIEVCSNQGFLPWLQRNCQKHKPRRNLMPKRYLHGPVTWKVTQRNAWKDIANLRINQLNNYTKSRHHVWMTTIF